MVVVHRVNLDDKSQPRLTDFLNPKTFTDLPNTAGCFTTEDALRTLAWYMKAAISILC